MFILTRLYNYKKSTVVNKKARVMNPGLVFNLGEAIGLASRALEIAPTAWPGIVP